MTDLEHPPVSEAPAPHSAGRPDGPERSKRRRWFKALVVFLLVAIPAGYIVISAEQSRDSGQNKEQEASATGLTNGWPSKVQRRIYNIPIPGYSKPVYYYEANSWKTSSLFVQFRTNHKGLDRFMHRVGTSSDALKMGDITIDERRAAEVGWDFTDGEKWAGTVHEQKAPEPTQRIVVNYDEKKHPVVYVVSTIDFKGVYRRG